MVAVSEHGALRLVLLALALGAGGCGERRTVDVSYDGALYPVHAPAPQLPPPPYAIVTGGGADALSLVDLRARRPLNDVPVGLYPVDGDGPTHLAFDRASGQVFVLLTYPKPSGLPGSHAAHASGTPFGKVARYSLPYFELQSAVSLAQGPSDVALSDDGGRLVIPHFDRETTLAPDPAQRNGEVYVFESASSLEPSLSPRILRPCIAPRAAALSRPDGARAWLACYGDDRVVALDLSVREAPVVVDLAFGQGPVDPTAPRFGPSTAALSPAGDRLLVGTTGAERVLAEVDVAAGTLRIAYRPAGAVFSPSYAPDGLVAYVPTQAPDGVARVDLASGAVLAERTFVPGECDRPHEAAYVASLGEVWLLCEGFDREPGAALALDPETLATRGSVATGVNPGRIVVVEP